MPYEELERQGRIKPYPARPEEIRKLLQVAARDLSAAERNLADDPDWAYSIAYNAALQAARALVLAEGFRPRGAEQQLTVVQFVGDTLGKGYSNQVGLFDQMRRKRHRVIYEVAGLVSRKEAGQAVAFAKQFVEDIRMFITKQTSLKF